MNLLYLVPGEVGGSEVAARQLLHALRRAAPGLELVLYAGPEAIESLREEELGGPVRFVAAPVPARAKPLRVASEVSWLPARLRHDGVELLHSMGTTAPPVSPVASVVTVLDLIYHHVPETFPAASRLGLRLLVPAAARRADRVIAISEAGKRDLVSTLGLPAEKVDVVHLGLGTPPTAAPTPAAELRGRLGVGTAPLVLCVSAALRHKNLTRLLEAFARVAAAPDPTLVVVGHAGREVDALRERAAALGLAERVRFTGWVSGADLEGLYAEAGLFVYPSYLEGFGLPLLEAMRRGVPVACSSASALPEVAGDAAELFDPHDEGAITAAITRLLDDQDRRRELVARGHRRWPQFTWERTARHTLDVYRRALAARLGAAV